MKRSGKILREIFSLNEVTTLRIPDEEAGAVFAALKTAAKTPNSGISVDSLKKYGRSGWSKGSGDPVDQDDVNVKPDKATRDAEKQQAKDDKDAAKQQKKAEQEAEKEANTKAATDADDERQLKKWNDNPEAQDKYRKNMALRDHPDNHAKKPIAAPAKTTNTVPQSKSNASTLAAMAPQSAGKIQKEPQQQQYADGPTMSSAQKSVAPTTAQEPAQQKAAKVKAQKVVKPAKQGMLNRLIHGKDPSFASGTDDSPQTAEPDTTANNNNQVPQITGADSTKSSNAWDSFNNHKIVPSSALSGDETSEKPSKADKKQAKAQIKAADPAGDKLRAATYDYRKDPKYQANLAQTAANIVPKSLQNSQQSPEDVENAAWNKLHKNAKLRSQVPTAIQQASSSDVYGKRQDLDPKAKKPSALSRIFGKKQDAAGSTWNSLSNQSNKRP